MEASDKLVRFARVLNIVGKVLAAICIFAATCVLVATIGVALIPQDALYDFFTQIELAADLGFLVPGTLLSDIIPAMAMRGIKAAILSWLISILIYCIICAVILFIVSAVFKSTAAKRSPFLPENVKRLKIIGVILIVISIFLGLQNLIFAFCLLAFAFIFQYGTEL